MRAKLVTAVVAATALVALAAPVFAHHSFAAEFDVAKPVTLTGVVTKVEWMNPHTYFYVDVKDSASGKVTNWACEMGSPNGLTRQGWTRNTLNVGMIVALAGTRAKVGSTRANVRNVTVDGNKLGAASSEGVTP
ncbi:MAG: hypothetical protein DMG12_08890 [Acidobacteria bacterium]|nr:MAG: hypothetical protein DMG12_08890 [Acidobacteriota bacterium]